MSERITSYSNEGLTFEVTDAGPLDDPAPIVLLHGFPQSAVSWEAVTPHLVEAGHRVLAPNQRGYSPGARPDGRGAYRTSNLVDDIRALIDAAGTDQVHLVGHDWGAVVAWNAALTFPDRLGSLVAVSVPHPAAFMRALVTSRQGLSSWYMYAFQLPRLPERLLDTSTAATRKRMVRQLVGSGQSQERAERDVAVLAALGSMTPEINWYRAMMLGAGRSTFDKVTVPTTLVWSSGDNFVKRRGVDLTPGYVDAAYRLEELPGVSHWIPDEQPLRLAGIILDRIASS